MRLVTDWTIGLLFGRDAAELGQLGHPPPLEEQTSGGSAAPGDRPADVAAAQIPPN